MTDKVDREHIADIMGQYLDLMTELKVRQDSMTLAVSGGLPLHPRIAYEHCYLQLRMICETIALSCLVVHGDIPATKQKKLKKAFEPHVIIGELEKLHPKFYPQPGKQIIGKDGKVVKVQDIEDGYLTKADLISLWAKCGDVLHRGSLKNLELRLNKGGSFQKITSWSQKIVTLLNHHQIALFNSTSQIWVIMQSDIDGNPRANLFELVHGAERHPK
jgi:hypothetical protein